MQVLECEAHGNATRLTCADCGTPICPQCLVKTEVGLKCAEQLYAVGVDGSAPTRLTTDPGADGEPAWSPDGTALAFASNRDGAAQIYTARPDGSAVRRLTTGPRNFAPSYAPDGSMLVFVHEPVPQGG